ncbi:alpha/beta hydrolase [Gynuella sunshinyii]|uniref:Esterase/lipase n=1 Tax=Gynuella sunshinyii YC6258 TaxID=1445510 RepID=A0A0C5VEN2_9GAMM|nr:alpha/beta hydrolase [Gynuella sunshinyii]AJQ93027.1 esterase/lipase [Gynuella sunshinyii YC6258]
MQTIENMRAGYRAMIPAAGTPDEVAEARSIRFSATDPQRMLEARLYIPKDMEGQSGLPVVLFFHGGGFVSGDFDTHDVLVRAIANRAGVLVLVVNYRLAPEYPFPAALEDAYATAMWVEAHAEEIGADRHRIAVAGDSAGANLATELTMLVRDTHGPKVIAQWLMYGSLSNRMDTASWQQYGETGFPSRAQNQAFIDAYVPEGISLDNPRVAPLWGSHNDLPPALMQVGELDPLRDENMAYAEALEVAGVEVRLRLYKGHQHGFIQFFKDHVNNPDGEHALNEGVVFLRKMFDLTGD